MHLKRVELENFKSFGRRLTIPFLDGFTAITGPNGSGKSNIGDAVLFVLGPKSNKAIRAGKLSDLIFNGGKEKKPASECSVSLVFDNHDRVIPVEEDEVTLTRVIRRSRANDENYNSYFKVNGRPSSLTEFDDLLAKARISAEGYNIVRQGDVLRIVDMTPLQRRAVIDEIAGITRFDSDIEKANKERAEAETNLTQIKIILAEIGTTLSTLDREREAALKYKAVQDELAIAKARLVKRRLDGASSELLNLQQLVESGSVDLVELDRKHAELVDKVREADIRIENVDKKIVDRAGPEAKDLKGKIDAIKREAIIAEQKLNHARTEIEEARSVRAARTADLRKVEKDLAKYQKERDAAATAKEKAAADSADADEALASTRRKLSLTTGKASDVNRELADLRLRHDKAVTELHEAKLAHERATERRSRLAQLVAENEEAQETERFTLKDLGFGLRELPQVEDVEKLRKAHFDLKKKESKFASDLRELEPIVLRLQQSYGQLKAQHDAQESLRTGGFSRAVDAILTARDQGKLRGICGTVAELASVDKRLALAMEIAAGGRMQAVIVETDADAAAAIDHLKKNKAGRATFLPLNKMTPGRPGGRALMAVRSPDAEGFALDLVRFDEKYRNAFWYVFHDTVVVKTLEGARKLMGGVRLVTLEGDLIDAQGAMTGGDKASAGEPKIKFGASEAQQFDKVRKDLQVHIAHQEALSQQLSDVRAELVLAETRLREATGATDQRATKAADLERRKTECAGRIETLTRQFGEMKREMLAVENEIKDLDRSINKLGRDLADMEKEREEKGSLLKASTPKDLAKELETHERNATEQREKARDAEARLTTKTTELELLAARRVEVADALAAVEASIAEHERAIEANGAIQQEKEEELTVLLALDEQHSTALQALNKERSALEKERYELRAKVEKAHADRSMKEDQITGYRARIPLVEAQLGEIREEIAALSAPLPDHVTESQTDLKDRVRGLERQLDGLGAVNLLALEEFERQSARKSSLEADVVRLDSEREHLIQVVDEIVAKKRTGFFKVYDEINQNFSKTYERLSNGGKAELILENPEAPFEGGMSMRAQPPGKKVTRLEALSGGEKSLTSMAFIFAIQEFDPSPFYYLDEVDQNLDGLNSELLARMVKEEAKHAQFIIVSLRKVTLKEAEHVYGVTMTEMGLSEIIGEVRISELADEPLAEGDSGGTPSRGAPRADAPERAEARAP